MQCSEIERLIGSLVDDDLDLSIRKNVEAHLKGCPACGRIFEDTQRIRNVLKNSMLMVSPSNTLDQNVMEAFIRRQAARQSSKAPAAFWLGTIFNQIVIPRPAFILLAAIFASLLGIAFQMGRISVSPAQRSPVENTRQLSQHAPNNPAPAKAVEVPVAKIAEVPVFREKIITRYVYLNRRKGEKIQAKSRRQTDFRSENLASKSSLAEDGFITQTSLKGFKPMPEIKIGVIKGGKDYER